MTSDCTPKCTYPLRYELLAASPSDQENSEPARMPAAAKIGRPTQLVLAGFDAHAVEATVHEEQRDHEEQGRQTGGESGAAGGGEIDGQRYGQDTEQRRELDDRI